MKIESENMVCRITAISVVSHNLCSKVVKMRKSTVIASIVLVLISILLVGMSPVFSQDEGTQVTSKKFNLGDQTNTVVFYTDSSRTTMYVPGGDPLGESLPEVPNGSSGWLIDGTGTYLTANTAITGDMTVTAVYPVEESHNEGDFMQGVSGYLTAQTENNGNVVSKVSALIASPFDEKNLKACFTETGTTTDADNKNFCSNAYPPSVWTFEFVSCTDPGKECDYYVRSGSNYLNISGGKVTLGSPAALRIVKLGDNLYNIKNGNGYLNLKYENDSKNNLYFKSSDKGTYQGSKISVSTSLPMSEFHTLTFDVDGGNVYPGPKSVQAYAGEKISLPAYSGTKNSHSFEGWATEKNGTALSEYSMPTEDVTLYAVYSSEPILWLDVNGGPGLETSSFIEGPVTLPGAELLSRDGYRLVGWSEDKTASEADSDKIIPAGASYPMPDHEVTLYAIWQREVRVTFVSLSSGSMSFIASPGDVIDLSAADYPRVSTWYYEKNGAAEYIHVEPTGDEQADPLFTVPFEDVTFYEPKTVTVAFDANGGEGTREAVQAITGERIELTADGFTRDGSTGFAGWRTDPASGTIYIASYTAGQDDVTLYAAWNYSVSFETGGGDQAGPEAISGLNGDGANGQTLPEYTGKNGGKYDFVGWITVSPDEFDPQTHTVYAPEASLFEDGADLPRASVYHALYKVPVTLYKNNGSDIIGPDLEKVNGNSWSYSASPKEPLDLTQFSTTRNNKVLLGWAPTEKDKVLITGDYYPGTTGRNELWAFWGSEVTFDAKGRIDQSLMPAPIKGFKPDAYYSSGGDLYSSSFRAPAAPNFGNHNFLGWTNEAAGNSVKYKVGDVVSFNSDNMKLYGLWDGYVKVRFSENNGTKDDNLSKENKIYEVGAGITLPSYSGTKEGRTFSGWALESNLEKNAIIDVYPAGSTYTIPDNGKEEIVFYAVWFKSDKLPPVKFGIRLDRDAIPQEPGSHPNTEFTTKAGLKKGPGGTNDWKIGNVLFDNAVKTQQFILDNAHPVDPPKDQYYLANNVTAALNFLPSVDDVVRILGANGIEFNPETDFILWYVLKYQPDAKWNGETYEGDYCWHVDGIVLSREKVSLNYDKGNTLPADHRSYWSLPEGFQVLQNSTTEVGRDGGADHAYGEVKLVSGRPHDGYAFIGWTTTPDYEEGDELLQDGDPITLGTETVTLYAQWERPMKEIKVEKHWQDGGNAASTRPASITVYPLADGVKLSQYNNGITLSGDGSAWSSAAVSVPVHTDDKNHTINYTWEEKLPDASKDDYVQLSNTVSGDTTVIKNTLVVSSTVTKVWADGDEKHAEDGITAVLKRSVNDIDDPDFAVPVELSGENGWSHTESGLSRLEESTGTAYKYYWRETQGKEAYTPEYADGDNNTTITNSRIEIPITITAGGDTWVYDGTAHEYDSFDASSITAGELDEGDTLSSLSFSGSQTVAGSSVNVPSGAVITDAGGKDVTGKYKITYVNGKLEVTAKPITITADSGTHVYDGTAFAIDGYTNDELGTGDKIDSVTVSGSQTVVGTSDNVASDAVIKNKAGEDVTSSYTITYVDGTLTVSPLAVTITADSDTKVYDGTALTKGTYTYTALAAGDSLSSVTVTGSQKDAGSSDNVPSEAKIVNAGGEDVTESYAITYANGTLEVTKKAVTITADSDSKIYDGTALTNDGYKSTALAAETSVEESEESETADTVVAEGDGLASGDTIESVTVTGSQIEVGTSDNVPSEAKIVNADGKDVTGNYTITYSNGTLGVTKKNLTITAGSGDKVYDGTALTNDSYTNSALAEGDKIDSVTVTGSQTVVGSSDNVPSEAKIVNAADEDMTANYEITYTNGTLGVTAKTVTITAASDTKTYDGTALTKDSYTNTALAEGDSLSSVTVTGLQIVVGFSENVPSEAKIVNADGEDVTASYAITYANGSLEVKQMGLTITADSDTRTYNGAALTVNSYGSTGLAEGDSFESVTVTGSQTVFGTANNVPSAAKIVNAAGEDVTASYDITYTNGTLEVTKLALTITAEGDEKVYDGTALTKNSYTNTDLATGDEIDSVTVTGSQTVVGSSDNVPSAAVIKNAAGDDVTASYEITYANGTLEVMQKELTITADGDNKVYDGTALTKTSYTNSDLASGDRVDSVTITGSQTVVGASDNVPSAAVIVNADGDDVTDSYEISYANGTLEVTKMAVTITADSDSKAYDGTALTKNSYTHTDLASGDSVDSVTVTGSQTVVGASNNVPSAAKIVNSDGADVTASYEFSYVNGTLEVTKKDVTITADSDSKVYDGTALTKDSYTNTALASGDKIDSVTVTGSQTVAGASDNVPSAAVIKNAAEEDVTASYEITYANGTLEVTQKAVTITADSDTKIYDAAALTKDSYTNTALAEGDSIDTVTVTGSQTVVGTSDNVPSAAVIKNAADEDVTGSYDITYANGTLEVTKMALTITADSDTKVYDAAALTKDSYTNTALAEGDKIDSVTVTGSQTVVGTNDNVPSAAVIKNAADEDVTGSYEITYANGTLQITQNDALIITADSDTKVYDGSALTKNSYQAAGLAEGDQVESVTVTGSQIMAGTSDNVPSAAKIVNADGVDVTASYEITYANGTLEVTAKTITITADSDEKVYDGAALTKDSYTNTDLASGDSITSVTVTGSQTVVGTSDNVPSAAVIKNADDEDVTESYAITYTSGTLEVTAKTITITADSDEKVYDGTALTKDSYTNTALAEGDSISSVTVTGSQIVVGSSNNVPSAAVIKNTDDEDVTSSYTITYENGSLEVTQKELTITADSDTKVYDGAALTKDSYTNTDLAAGDSVDSVTVTGTQTVVGTIDNLPSAAKIVNAAGEDVTASYKISYVNGTLEVTTKTITITADSDEKVYDGAALTKGSYTNTDLATGDSIDSVTVTGSRTVVGSSDNVPSGAVILNAGGADVTASYEITYANGTLEVTQKAVTITADSDSKVYDGTALTKDSYTNTDLASGDSITSVTVTGSQTVVGTSDNIPSAAVIKNAAGEDVTGSYDITYANGTLEVTQKDVTITADSDKKTYDGTALTKDSYTNTALAEGDSIDTVTVTGSQTVVGTSDNVPSAAVIKNAAGDDVTGSYAITYANGTLEVTKMAVTITADSDTKVYDGTALTKDSYTNTALAEGDSLSSVTVTGSQTVVGEASNVPSAAVIKNAADEDVTGSYEITYVNGALSVTVNQSAVITADSDTKVYDGSALTKNSYQAAGLAEGDRVDSVTVTGSQTVFGSSDNVPSAAKIVNTAGEDVTASYEVTYRNGTLAITKKSITITADGGTKVYDGAALTKDSYTNSDLAEGDRIDSVTVRGSQTVVGTSVNTPSAAKIVNTAGDDVTGSYDITYVNGTLQVTQKSLTITADSAEKVYDGSALTKNSYTNSDLAGGDSITSVTITGSQTVVGTSYNVPTAAVIKNAAGEDVTDSYAVTYANGTLEVTRKSLTVTAGSSTKVYDGSALTKNSYTGTALATGDSFESVTVTGSQTVVGTSDNIPSAAVIRNAERENVTASYDITYVNGTLEVTQKALTITADSDTKVYDGTALTKDSFTNTALAAGDSIESVTVTGSQTVYGSSANVPSAAVIKNAAGENVTASYDITYANGTLDVTKKAVTISAESATKVYDAAALTANSYITPTLADGDHVGSLTVTGSQTIVGESDNVPSAAVIRNAANEDVTDSYDITYANGTLLVTVNRAVIITADSDSKVYDGTALTKNAYHVTGLAGEDSVASVTVTGSQTVVGTSDNVPSAAKIVNAAGEDVTASYEITYKNGSVKVTAKPLTITADNDTKTYDGTALTKNSYTNTALAALDSIDSVTVTGSQTVYGSSANVPSAAVILNAAGENVTASYDITYANGTLGVTKKAVTVTADSGAKTYNGAALTKNSFTNTALAAGDSIAVTVTGSQTVVGKTTNIPSSAVIRNAAQEDVTDSYAITYVNGTLEVTQKALTITADSASKVYDAEALIKNSYTSSALASGDVFDSVTVTGSQVLAGKSANVPSDAKIVNAAGEDVTASYAITYVNGTLEVTPKPIFIIGGSDTKVYDGTALTKNSYTGIASAAAKVAAQLEETDIVSTDGASSTPVAPGDRIASVTLTGSQTDAGSSENVPSGAVILNTNGDDVTSSYLITYIEGTLKVTPKPVTIVAGSDEKEYDGTALTNEGFVYTDLAPEERIQSVVLNDSQTEAGATDNVPSGAVITNANGDDVTANYTITYISGTLEVIRKAVTITADSAEKVYDGIALVMNSYTNTDLVEGDLIDSVTISGSQTLAGSSANVPSEVKIVNAQGADVTSNYQVKYVNGTLKVTQKSLTITADSDTKVYDGKAFTNTGYSMTGELAEGDTLTSVTVTGSQTAAGESKNVPSDAVILNPAEENVTASYNISYVDGNLEVTKKELLIRADSETKVYDGASLHKDSYTTSELAEGDRIDSITVSGSRIQAGTSPNEVKDAVLMNEAGEVVNDNYTISYIKGTLYVAPAPVTVAADSFTKEYGQLDVSFTAKVTGVLEGESISQITYELSREEGENPGEYVITPSGVKLQGNYSVTYLPGRLTITWNPTTFSAEKVWNDDNNRDGIRPVSLGVILTGSDGSIRTRRLTEANGWKVSVEDLPLYNGGQTITYTWSEEEVPGYDGTSEVLGNVTIFTNTHAITRTTATVTKIWDDRENAGGTRPDFLGVILFSNGERVFAQTLSDENDWTLTVDNLPMYENGTQINYVWNEQSAGNGYYAVRSTASGGTTTLVNSNLYTLKIRFTYADGSEAAADYVDRLGFGETFVVDSPEIAGFTAGQASVIGVMPAHDVEFIVIYTPEGEETQKTSVVEARNDSGTVNEESNQKEIPQPREQMAVDDDHAVVLQTPTRHVNIDEYGSALGLGEVFMTTGGKFSFE